MSPATSRLGGREEVLLLKLTDSDASPPVKLPCPNDSSNLLLHSDNKDAASASKRGENSLVSENKDDSEVSIRSFPIN